MNIDSYNGYDLAKFQLNILPSLDIYIGNTF